MRDADPSTHVNVRQHIGRPTRRGTHRGPRRAAEPTGDIKLRLSKASEAFIEENYVEAAFILAEIIRINAETHEAWTLLASIFQEAGDIDNTLKALIYAAHLRPKHSSAWFACAEFALEETGSLRSNYLVNAEFCYSAAIRADPKNIEARLRKAEVCAERGKSSTAISDYKQVLIRQPHNTKVLRALAELSIDCGEVDTAINLYREAIQHFKLFTADSGQMFDWNDASTYITLYENTAQYDIAVKELKSVARWLLGRVDESFWDQVDDDDCEWDELDTRRHRISEFKAGKHPVSSYGSGLPLPFRVKLGLYRLHLAHHDEAMVILCSSTRYSKLFTDSFPEPFRLASILESIRRL